MNEYSRLVVVAVLRQKQSATEGATYLSQSGVVSIGVSLHRPGQCSQQSLRGCQLRQGSPLA